VAGSIEAGQTTADTIPHAGTWSVMESPFLARSMNSFYPDIEVRMNE
jgi:hypothetical protein